MPTSLDNYAPYDTGAGADVREDTWRKMMRHMRGSTAAGSGVLRGSTNEMMVYADDSGMQVKVRTGECWLRAAWGELEAEKTLPLAPSDSTNARKDRVILRNAFASDVIELDVLEGVPGAGVAPGVTQDTTKWETSLAIVDVPANDMSIEASQVVDARIFVDNPPPYAVKTTNKDMTNNSTLSDDTQLQLALSVNATYAFDSCLIYSAETGADVKFSMSGPSGATAQISGRGLHFPATTFAGDIETLVSTLGGVWVSGGAGAANKVTCHAIGTIVTSTAAGGLVTVRFAQNTAQANTSTLYAGSWIKVTRIA